MAKKKQKRRASRGSKSNLIPLAAVAIGVYLLMKDKAAPVIVAPVKQGPTLPGKQQPGQTIGTRPNRQRYINIFI